MAVITGAAVLVYLCLRRRQNNMLRRSYQEPPPPQYERDPPVAVIPVPDPTKFEVSIIGELSSEQANFRHELDAGHH